MMNAFAKLLIGLVTVIALLVGMVGMSFAQEQFDAGGSGLNHPALVNYRVGVFYQLKADHERAIAEFTLAIDGVAGFGTAYAARGDSYAALEDYEHALADYDAALALFPDFVSVLYARGRAYLALGETEQAEADFSSAVEQMPDYAMPYFGLGDVAFAQGEYGEALSQYQAYLTRLEDAPDALVLGHMDTLTIMAEAGTL
jgi:tetratricopeptide (TPR) repeat protein